MASTLNPYLSFVDTARDAMEFYKSIFGGELTIHTFGSFGADDSAISDLVMHASLVTPAGYSLFASDAPPGMVEFSSGSQITVSLSGPHEDAEELRGYWNGLAEDGTVHMPLEKQIWGDDYGQLTDRFGIPWMVNIAQPEGA